MKIRLGDLRRIIKEEVEMSAIPSAENLEKEIGSHYNLVKVQGMDPVFLDSAKSEAKSYYDFLTKVEKEYGKAGPITGMLSKFYEFSKISAVDAQKKFDLLKQLRDERASQTQMKMKAGRHPGSDDYATSMPGGGFYTGD
jgi:hypothetical protein